jgi:spore maturation protein CgeB
VKILVVGKVASITHWLEDCVAAWRADGHQVRVVASRNPVVSPLVERLLLAKAAGAPMARHIGQLARRTAPDLIAVIGAFHVPEVILEEMASLSGRAPMIGWVGDLFSSQASRSAQWLDAVAYTDGGLMTLHREFGFESPAHYLPHAVNPHVGAARAGTRRRRLVFVANPTEHRRRVVSGLRSPITIHGPGWTSGAGVTHEIVAPRLAKNALHRLYGEYLGALNIRNEYNVLTGLNQRNFDPCLAETAVVTEHQADLERCFDPGREVLVYRDIDELNDIHDRLLADPGEALAIGRAGRARVLAEHTYERRLRVMVKMA